MGATEAVNRFEIFRNIDDFERHAAGDVVFAEGDPAEHANV